MPPEQNPRHVFERLFGADADDMKANLAMRRRTKRSILDFVAADARSLENKIGKQDGRKLDEYLTSVREIEQRIARLEQLGEAPRPDYAVPDGIPDPFEYRMRVMFDMIVLAFQTDSTRIATMILAHDGSNRSYPEIGVARGHHDLSHHQGKAENLDPIAQIDKHHMKYFAQFLEKLAQSRDADGTSILHNSMIVYAGGNGDGNAHSHTNLPVILAGAGGGKLTTGRFHQLDALPMSNMYVEMLRHMGVTGVDRFGDSTDRPAAI
jgi:hypothetical protein